LHTEVHGLLGWWFFDCRQDPGPASLGQTVGYWCIKALPSDGVSGSATQIKSVRTNRLAIAMLVFASL
jgi:hypothetical protein